LLARAEDVNVGPGLPQPPASGTAVVGEAEIFVPLAGLIDLEVERSRLGKEAAKFRRLLAGLDGKLSSAAFLDKAPPEVVERERERRREYGASLERLEASLARLVG
jgi:valyl-tRNA synthetase